MNAMWPVSLQLDPDRLALIGDQELSPAGWSLGSLTGTTVLFRPCFFLLLRLRLLSLKLVSPLLRASEFDAMSTAGRAQIAYICLCLFSIAHKGSKLVQYRYENFKRQYIVPSFSAQGFFFFHRDNVYLRAQREPEDLQLQVQHPQVGPLVGIQS